MVACISCYVFTIENFCKLCCILVLLYRAFLTRHPKLQFIGLALTEVCGAPMFTDETNSCYQPHLTVRNSSDTVCQYSVYVYF